MFLRKSLVQIAGLLVLLSLMESGAPIMSRHLIKKCPFPEISYPYNWRALLIKKPAVQPTPSLNIASAIQPTSTPSIEKRQKRSARLAYLTLSTIRNSPKAKEALAAVGASVYAYKTKDIWARLFLDEKTTAATTKSPLAAANFKTTRLTPSESSILAARANPSSYLSRNKRALGILVKAVPHVGNFVKWTSIFGVASVAGSVATHYLNERENEKLTRKTIECRHSNFGCIGGYCWTNCGPRLFSADWCFTTKNTSELNYIPCVLREECDPCLQCGSICHLELGSGSGVPPGTITPQNDSRKKSDNKSSDSENEGKKRE